MPKGIPGSRAPHGTLARYTHHSCRCEACKDARRAYAGARPAAAVRAERRAAADARNNHGTETRYSRGCRCAACRAAATEARRQRRDANLAASRAYDRDYKRRARHRAAA